MRRNHWRYSILLLEQHAIKLIVGRESSWSIRAWICAQLAGLEVTEVVIPLGCAGYQSTLRRYSDTGLVPVLLDRGCRVHDSLAIAEYLNEHADVALYPSSPDKRAFARSLCAEMHAGFPRLRATCPFSVSQISKIETGPELAPELTRMQAIFAGAQTPFMFERPGAVDAFYAVMAYRLNSYGICFEGAAGAYQQSLLDWPLLKMAMQKARQWTLLDAGLAVEPD